MQRIMEILDRNKTILLSVMTVPPGGQDNDDEWLVVLRLKTTDIEQIAGAFRSSGFNVTHVG